MVSGYLFVDFLSIFTIQSILIIDATRVYMHSINKSAEVMVTRGQGMYNGFCSSRFFSLLPFNPVLDDPELM